MTKHILRRFTGRQPLCIAILAALATPAMAQIETLEEVTVTATRRETTIFEVPYAISAISIFVLLARTDD